MKKILTVAVLVAIFCGGTVARASDFEDSNSIASTIEQTVPGFANSATDNDSVSQAVSTAGDMVVTATEKSLPSAEALGLSLRVPGITSIENVSLGQTSFIVNSGPDGVFQETPTGFRIIRVIETNADLIQNYVLQVTGSATLEPIADGFLIVDGQNVFGSISNPWAFDANGVEQPTYFVLRNSTLQQIIEPLPGAKFPIVADPEWVYSFTYTTTSSPNTNWIKIHNCFNCYFPVSGALAAYPAPNELLPLWITAAGIGVINMECRMGTSVLGTQNFSWSFRATSHHYDGFGSRISFNLRYLNNVPRLVVSATIVNDFGQLLNGINSGAAQANWQQFAYNLNTK